MKVAGLGFRRDVTLASLREALAAAGDCQTLAAIATVSDKAETEAFRRLANELNVPIKAISPEALAGIVTLTQSERIKATFATGSVAEAAALAAAGGRARLLTSRVVSQDHSATAAIAEGDGE